MRLAPRGAYGHAVDLQELGERCIGRVQPRRIRTRCAPACLSLDDAPGERHLTEHAAESSCLVPSTQVRERIDRIVRRMESTRARALRGLVGVLLGTGGDRRGGRRPHRVVEHRAEPDSRTRLPDRPDAPGTHTDAAHFADSFAGLHYRAPANRTSAGWMTSSTSPYATASSGVMK